MGLYSVLAILHALAGATWLGAMVYSFVVLHPHARRYFRQETEFEAFIAAISHGARWPVLLALARLRPVAVFAEEARHTVLQADPTALRLLPPAY